MKKLNLLERSFSQLKKMLVYREISEDALVKKVSEITLQLAAEKSYNHEDLRYSFYDWCSSLIEVAETEKITGEVWKSYLLKLITTSENVFAIFSEKYGEKISNNLKEAVLHDLEIISSLFKFSLYDIGEVLGEEIDFLQDFSPSTDYSIKVPYLYKISELKSVFATEKDPDLLIKYLIDYYNSVGAGRMGYYTTFRWNKDDKLIGINHPDPVKLDSLIGYEKQKKRLTSNTEAFLQGNEANNVLLFGDSGTGKSSSVKALANEYSNRGLRLVEISKHQIKEIPEILDSLRKRGLYFILFMDDLSFDDFETDYKYLKSLMEGGVETKPSNVLFYATSNRRNLIQESWSDRSEQNGEIHLSDALQEKYSLAERFGMIINYHSPDQNEYLDIIQGLAGQNGVKLDKQELEERALQWERWHNGRSGRSARQFINHLSDEK